MMIRAVLAGMVVLAAGACCAPTASAAGGQQVPDAVKTWFRDEARADIAVLDDVPESNVVVGAPVPDVRLQAPEYDLESQRVVKGGTTLSSAIHDDDRYCALVRMESVSLACVQHHEDDSVELTDLASNIGLLPGVTELPRDGVTEVVPGVGMFGIDLEANTVTALDEGAKTSLPQGTADATVFLVALGKHWAERIAYEKTMNQGAGGGAAPGPLDLSAAAGGDGDSADVTPGVPGADVVARSEATPDGAGGGRSWLAGAAGSAGVLVAAAVLLVARRRSRRGRAAAAGGDTTGRRLAE